MIQIRSLDLDKIRNPLHVEMIEKICAEIEFNCSFGFTIEYTPIQSKSIEKIENLLKEMPDPQSETSI